MQEEGLSLLAQSNRLHEYADRKDLEVIRTFEIVESSTRGQRKQFMEMINFCKKQKETIAIIFENITLTEGVISYKLRFSFNEFVNINTPKGNKVLPHEPLQTLAEQGVQANDNENVQFGSLKSCEPQFIEKKRFYVR